MFGVRPPLFGTCLLRELLSWEKAGFVSCLLRETELRCLPPLFRLPEETRMARKGQEYLLQGVLPLQQELSTAAPILLRPPEALQV